MPSGIRFAFRFLIGRARRQSSTCTPCDRRRLHRRAAAVVNDLIDRAKSVREAIGLVPAVLGLFAVVPNWLAPSEYYQPDISYVAGGVSLGVFLVALG
jgi:hypothetical protein